MLPYPPTTAWHANRGFVSAARVSVDAGHSSASVSFQLLFYEDLCDSADLTDDAPALFSIELVIPSTDVASPSMNLTITLSDPVDTYLILTDVDNFSIDPAPAIC